MSEPLNAVFVLRDEPSRDRLHAFLRNNWRAAADAGRPLAVSIVEHRAKRSSAANRRYWAILNEISAGAWVEGKQFSADAWHEFFKAKFIGSEELPHGGYKAMSSAALNVADFKDYTDRIEAYAATELGLELI